MFFAAKTCLVLVLKAASSLFSDCSSNLILASVEFTANFAAITPLRAYLFFIRFANIRKRHLGDDDAFIGNVTNQALDI